MGTATGPRPWVFRSRLSGAAEPERLAPDGPTGPSPTFTWTASENVTYYYIRVSDVAGTRVDQWLTPIQVGCSSGSGTCTFSPAVVLNAGVARWQVLAWSPSGYSPWSSLLAFTVSSGPPIANPIPAAVTPVAPGGVHGDTDVHLDRF